MMPAAHRVACAACCFCCCAAAVIHWALLVPDSPLSSRSLHADAIGLMKHRRPAAYPNLGFWRLLMELELETHGRCSIPPALLSRHHNARDYYHHLHHHRHYHHRQGHRGSGGNGGGLRWAAGSTASSMAATPSAAITSGSGKL